MKEYRIMTGERSIFGLGSPINECGVFYIAYRESGEAITEGNGRVLIACDESSYKTLSNQIEHYSVMRVMADMNDATFRVKELLEVCASPLKDEEVFLAQQSLPVSFIDPQFGEFVLDKKMDWFSGTITYQDREVSVSLDTREDIETLRYICGELKQFVERASYYAASQLLELGNDWCEDAWQNEAGEDEEYIPMTEDDFVKRITLNNIGVSEDGLYSLWFDDGDIFWGHVITVYGDIESGFTEALMQG